MTTPVFPYVLVGWDGSYAAAEGLKIACALTAYPGGHVTALSVVPGFAQVEDQGDRERALAEARRPLQAEYDRIIESLTLLPDQRVSLRFLEDERAGAALDKAAAEQSADLMVIGLHGREGILHPKMGHIANHVIKSSSCPVLLIPDTRMPGASHGHEPSPLTTVVKGLLHPSRHHAAGV